VVGAGAVGCLVGGKLAQAGHDITLIDAWPEHVDALQRDGLRLQEPGATQQVPVRALHVGQAQSLIRHPVDVAFICVKLYDTEWATALIAPYLAPAGYVVTLQNGLIEDVVAARVGWERTVGCIGGGLHVGLAGPGHLRRARDTGASRSPAFYVGEAHGRITPRARVLAEWLGQVDIAQPTANLWGMRWSKLVANTMTSALDAASGLGLKRLFEDGRGRRVMCALADEALALGAALGYDVQEVFGLPAQAWADAARGDAAALARAGEIFDGQQAVLTYDAVAGTAQDIAKGRRTEVEFMNGYVAARARQAGLQAPTHEALAAMVRAMEAGQARPAGANLDALVAPLS
jgi:2-dehydropantoate 2-reductase